MIATKFSTWLSSAETLRQRATLASAWAITGFGLQKILQLASNLVLTRLLFPEAFGLMALATVILIGIGMFSDVGIKPAIVQSEHGDQEQFLNTAWTFQVIRGITIWIGCCLIAWPASLIYGQPVLFGLICVLGSTAAIGGFSSTALALKEKRLHLGLLTAVQLLGQLITLTVTALFAWLIGSVWSLAFGAVAASIITTVLGFVAIPSHRHRLLIDPASAKSLLTFGRWIFVSTIVTYLGGQGLRAVQGGLMPMREFGILAIAQTFASMPAELVGKVQDLVGFPALSEARREGRARFAGTFIKIRSRVLSGSLAMFFILALAAGPIVWTLYDKRYHEAGGYLALLCVTGPLSIISTGYLSAFLALGKVRLHANLQAVLMLTRIAGTVVGFELHGILGMLVGIGIGTFIGYLVVTVNASKEGLFSIKVDGLSLCLVAISAALVKILYY